MGNVLPFSRTRMLSRGNDAAEALPAGHTAQVLLFLGVRYERHQDIEPLNAVPGSLDGDDNSSNRRRKSRRRA
jgi:hypothetical protein